MTTLFIVPGQPAPIARDGAQFPKRLPDNTGFLLETAGRTEASLKALFGVKKAPAKPDADEGKQVLWHDGAWAQVDLPPPPPEPEPQYRELSVLEYEGLVEAVTGMTAEQYVAWEEDTNAQAKRVHSKLGKVQGLIPIDTQLVAYGLGVMDALGHRGTVPEGQLTAAVKANWPTI